MTVADVARFLVIIALGVLGFVTFLVAGTIIGLMVVDAGGCRDCLRYPVGLWTLAALAVFFIISMFREWNEAPKASKEWAEKNRTNLIIALIILIVFLYIFNYRT